MEIQEPVQSCAVESCDYDATHEVEVWWPPVATRKADEPLVMKFVPLCDEHAAEYNELGADEFFKKHPLKISL